MKNPRHSMRSSIRGGLAAALLLSSFGYSPNAAADAVAFMYHRFGESAYPSTNVRLEQFDAHLDHLAQAGYTVRPLEWIVARLNAGEALPDRTIAITIDDAYLSIYTEAWPRLRARGWPFTVFIATDPVDQGLPAHMSWDQVRELHEQGVTFANHSATHDHLVRRRPDENHADWRARVRADIERAQRRLIGELGSAPMLFAYPFGEYSLDLAEIVRGLGYVALGQHSGAIGPLSDRRALPRFPMAEAFADIDEFRSKAASLALPVIEHEPWDPVVTDPSQAPRLTFRLADSDARLSELSCFASRVGRIAVEAIEGETRVFTTRSPEPLPRGRSRYNCTAPSSEPGRFYWFSQPWLRLSGE
jgi:poly-beta-1,6-N-acetyl-D-glucosamine N-deacetylase